MEKYIFYGTYKKWKMCFIEKIPNANQFDKIVRPNMWKIQCQKIFRKLSDGKMLV